MGAAWAWWRLRSLEGNKYVKKSSSSCMLTDLMYFICAGRDFNRALPSGLITEERTQQLLSIAVGERDYRVALS